MKIMYSKHIDAVQASFGGKANNLIRLQQLGFQVPEFLVIPADLLQIENVPNDYRNQVLQQIDEANLGVNFKALIAEHFESGTYFAVRSSGLVEDGELHSFAGQYETLLYVSPNEIENAVKTIWKSAFSSRVFDYAKENQIAYNGQIAIIIQKMVQAESAGVAFAVNPINGADETIINAVYGLGEGLVSGELNADLYTVRDEAHIEKILAEKNRALHFDELVQKTFYQDVEQDKSESAALNDNQILEIHHQIKKLSAALKKPQDIEFAYENGRLYLLQTRPITSIKKETETLWDNSNIVESYPGITLPLTFHFILKMYEAVYRQLSAIMGIRQRKIEANSDVFANMLGLLWGRVYYNLNNWHRGLALLPGYELNAALMDNMMGVKEKFPTHKVKKTSKLREILDILLAIHCVLRNHRRIDKDRIKFQSYFNEIMKQYDAKDFSKMTFENLITEYQNFENTLVTKWKAPLVNDFFCMVYFGVLQKLVAKYQLDDTGTLHNDLVSGAKDIISTEPIDLTREIVLEIEKDKQAKIWFETLEPEKIWNKIQENQQLQISVLIQSYLKKWGARCVGELKMETITYEEQPENYMRILQSYIKDDFLNLTRHGMHHDLRSEAEEKVRFGLQGKPLKRLLFNYVLKKARYLVSNRENLRFERTRGFGMVRKMSLAMGEKLQTFGAIKEKRDVFYLSHQEIFDWVKGTSSHVNFIELVNLRKLEYTSFEVMDINERIRSYGSVYANPPKSSVNEQSSHELKGIGCCAGIVEGYVSVIHAPHEVDSLKGNILVTSSTDPGWVVLFPGAAAIVVERGSLLSHSAIVSREMGIPCVVGVKNLLKSVKTGDKIRMNGSTGEIKVLERN